MRSAVLAVPVFLVFAAMGFFVVGAQASSVVRPSITAVPTSLVPTTPPTSESQLGGMTDQTQTGGASGTAAATLVRGLIGEYFSLPDRGASLQLPAGDPTVRRIDGNIWFDWGRGSPTPRVGNDYFGVRWQGYLRTETLGKYVFQLNHNGLARLSIGGQVIYEQVARSALRSALKEYTVSTAGWVPIVVELVQGAGQSQMRLGWSPPNTTTFVPIPAYAFAHRER